MEWQVGQWVEVVDGMSGYLRVGDVYQVERITGQATLGLKGKKDCWAFERFKPFEWQTGKTYRTTLEGVTATITKIDSRGDVRGTASNSLVKGNEWTWSPLTGLMYGVETLNTEPHLLPFLADEPSEQKSDTSKDGEPTTTERFTVEQRGADWFVRDNLRGRVAKFRDQTSAKTACGMMKQGDEKWIWSDELKPEPVNPQASSPYDRVIGGVEVDLWTLADIYGITSHRLFSAWKKITMAGRRGPKDKLRDLREARVGLDKEIAKLEAEGGE